MVTRRVHKRQMLLIEDDFVRQVIEYTLGYCLSKYNVSLHAIVVEANHMHRVATDVDGIRPKFIRDFHSLVARQLNIYYDEGDAFFSNKPTNIVDNESQEDVLQRIVYTMGNPVADGIEREGKNHKGIRMRWPQPDKVIARPKGFWRSIENGGVAPDEITLHFGRPPGFESLSDEELDQLIEKRVLAYEKEKRDERDAEGPRINNIVEFGCEALLSKGAKVLRTAATEVLSNASTRDGSRAKRLGYLCVGP